MLLHTRSAYASENARKEDAPNPKTAMRGLSNGRVVSASIDAIRTVRGREARSICTFHDGGAGRSANAVGMRSRGTCVLMDAFNQPLMGRASVSYVHLSENKNTQGQLKHEYRRHPSARRLPDPSQCSTVPTYTSNVSTLADVEFLRNSLLNPNGFDLDEARGVGRLEATELVHGRLLRVVEALIR
jgi:hypothetical protein